MNRISSLSSAARALRLRAATAARDAFAGGDRRASAITAQLAVAAAFDEAWRAARVQVEAEGPLACRAGCDACCHQHVAVLPIEALAIAAEFGRLGIAETQELRLRLASTDAATRDLDASARRRARIACAFLGAAGRCEIYAVRPMRCRGLHSRDAELCRRRTDVPDQAPAARARRAHADPAFPPAPIELADAVLAGLATACAERGIAHDALELAHAVQLLLLEPDRADALLAGADGLAEARLDIAARPLAKR